MEAIPSVHAGSGHRSSTSPSVGSFDIGQVTSADNTGSLLSESVSLASLSSKSSEGIPVFEPRSKSHLVTTVALGEDLKMFSTMFSPKKEKLEASCGTRAILAAPTTPRLKSMCKESLCINKWADHSTGWNAPGHVPWECAQEGGPTAWVPEGSLYSPESFSRNLSQARGREPEEDSFFQRNTDPGVSHQTHLDSELVKMVDELKDLRTFFEALIDEDQATTQSTPLNLPIPSLVVSNSYSTFPLPLDSSQNLALSLIASRRGTVAPPPLVLRKSVPISDIPYPDIPTAFLCSSKSGDSEYSCCDGNQNENFVEEKTVMCVEDMINNLRMQCLTMSLPSPPPDTSLNSRSAVEVAHEANNSSVVEAICSNFGQEGKPKKDPKRRARLSVRFQRRSEVKGPQKQGPKTTVTGPSQNPVRSKVPSPPMPLKRKPTNLVGNGTPQIRSPPMKPNSKAQSSLPSALPTNVENHKKVGKTVRFAVRDNGLQRDRSLPEVQLSSIRGGVLSRSDEAIDKFAPKKPTSPTKLSKTTTGHSTTRPASTSRVPSQSTSPTSLKHESPVRQKRAQSMSIARAPRQSAALARLNGSFSFRKLQVDETQRDYTDLQQSNTRRSLSKLIKGPMHALRVNRRATISISTTFETRYDENAARREEFTENKAKKSRLPTPLRSILTRIK